MLSGKGAESSGKEMIMNPICREIVSAIIYKHIFTVLNPESVRESLQVRR